MASPQRDRARRFLVEQGLSVGRGILAPLTFEILDAEERGERLVLSLINEHLGAECNGLIAGKLAERSNVPPREGVAPPGDDVADQDGDATAPCTWCVCGFTEAGIMCRARHGASYIAAPGPGEG